eukprot:7378368-Prymnesium_polylepis.1
MMRHKAVLGYSGATLPWGASGDDWYMTLRGLVLYTEGESPAPGSWFPRGQSARTHARSLKRSGETQGARSRRPGAPHDHETQPGF